MTVRFTTGEPVAGARRRVDSLKQRLYLVLRSTTSVVDRFVWPRSKKKGVASENIGVSSLAKHFSKRPTTGHH